MKRLAFAVLLLPSLLFAEALKVSWISWRREGELTPYPQWISEKHTEIMNREWYEGRRELCKACTNWETGPISDEEVSKICEEERTKQIQDPVPGYRLTKKQRDSMYEDCKDYYFMSGDDYRQKLKREGH